MKRLVLGIDFDGVITDPASLKIEWIREKLGVSIEPWQTVKHVASKIIGADAYQMMIDDVYAGSWFLRNKLRPDAVESMKILTELGHVLHIITSRFDHEAECARVLLEKEGVPYCEMVNVSNGSKLSSCRQKRIDVFIDDSQSKLVPLLELGILLCFYNVFGEAVEREGITSIASWGNFLKMVYEMVGR